LSALSIRPRPTPSSTLFPYTTLFRSHATEAPATETPTPTAEPESTAAATSNTIVVESNDQMQFNVNELHVKAGEPISLTLKHVRSESTRLNSSHVKISYAVFCLKKKN